jgi:hypothetical protein
MDSSNYRNAMRVKPANSQIDERADEAEESSTTEAPCSLWSISGRLFTFAGTAQLVMYLPQGDVPESVIHNTMDCRSICN